MTTKKQIICKCGHKKGVHQMNGLGKCRVKVKGRLCPCKKFSQQTKQSERNLIATLTAKGVPEIDKTVDVYIRLNDVIGLFKNRKRFGLKLEIRNRIMNVLKSNLPLYVSKIKLGETK